MERFNKLPTAREDKYAQRKTPKKLFARMEGLLKKQQGGTDRDEDIDSLELSTDEEDYSHDPSGDPSEEQGEEEEYYEEEEQGEEYYEEEEDTCFDHQQDHQDDDDYRVADSLEEQDFDGEKTSNEGSGAELDRHQVMHVARVPHSHRKKRAAREQMLEDGSKEGSDPEVTPLARCARLSPPPRTSKLAVGKRPAVKPSTTRKQVSFAPGTSGGRQQVGNKGKQISVGGSNKAKSKSAPRQQKEKVTPEKTRFMPGRKRVSVVTFSAKYLPKPSTRDLPVFQRFIKKVA